MKAWQAGLVSAVMGLILAGITFNIGYSKGRADEQREVRQDQKFAEETMRNAELLITAFRGYVETDLKVHKSQDVIAATFAQKTARKQLEKLPPPKLKEALFKAGDFHVKAHQVSTMLRSELKKQLERIPNKPAEIKNIPIKAI